MVDTSTPYWQTVFSGIGAYCGMGTGTQIIERTKTGHLQRIKGDVGLMDQLICYDYNKDTKHLGHKWKGSKNNQNNL